MVAVVAHEEHLALRHGERENRPLLAIREVVDVIFLEHHAVHIDAAQVEVDVNGLPRGRDDALDDGLIVKALLARDDDIADLIVAAQQRVHNEQAVAVLQGRDHRRPRNAHQPHEECKHQHNDQQRRDERRDRLIHVAPGDLFHDLLAALFADLQLLIKFIHGSISP